MSAPFPTGPFGSILADPPWPERGGGKVKRGADRHYELMTVERIAALPVASIAAPDAHLYLWVTNNYLPAGLEVMRAWGFKYVTNLCWGKAYLDPHHGVQEIPTVVVQQGLGQYFRGAHELLLFGKRGQPAYRTLENGKRAQSPSLVLAPRQEHSRKPDHFHNIVERVSHGPYVELFSRRPVPGWEAWGLEA